MKITQIYTGPLFVKTWIYPLDEKTLVIIDPGGLDDELIEHLEKVKPEKLEIMLTHGHFDHIGGIAGLLQMYPNSNVRIHKDDADFLGEKAEETHLKCFNPINAGRYITKYLEQYAFPNYTHLLQEGDTVNGLKVIHTPGHTPGSVCFWNEQEKILFSGDTLFCRACGRTDLYGGDEKQIQKSIKKLLKILPPETIVYPGHSSNTTIGAEINNY